jgi:hypothetical protein
MKFKHVFTLTAFLIFTASIHAAATPTPTPVSDERIKVMVKECAVDILLNTLEGADQTKIEELFNTISCKFNIALTQRNREWLYQDFCNIVKQINFCNTKAEQEGILNQYIAFRRITPL